MEGISLPKAVRQLIKTGGMTATPNAKKAMQKYKKYEKSSIVSPKYHNLMITF